MIIPIKVSDFLYIDIVKITAMSHKYFKVLFLPVGFSEPINDLHIMWNSLLLTISA